MDLFFELIQVAIGKRTHLSRVLSSDEWEEIYNISERQTLLGVMMDGLEILPENQRPPQTLLLQWIGITQQIEQRNKQLDVQAMKVSDNLEIDGFKGVVLKGTGLARLYPNPGRRQCGDIDLWIVEEGKSRDDVVRYLQRKGVNGRVVYHNIPMELEDETEVEIHFTPSWMNCWFTNRKLQQWFNKYRSIIEKKKIETNIGFRIPPASFNVIYVLQHIYRHLIGSGIGLRQLMDYYWVLQSKEENLDKRELEKTLHSLHMLKFTSAVMWVLGYVFGLEQAKMIVEPNEREGKFLLGEIMRAGNFGHYDERIVIPQNENKFHMYIRNTRQNMRLITHYPEEVVWSPLYRAWHYLWRKAKGYPIE